MCKTIISPGVFLNFKILIFWDVRGLKGQKMAQTDAPYIPGTIYHMIFIYGTHVSGPLLESKVMCEIFQKKGKVREKMLKKGKIFENLCKMFKI